MITRQLLELTNRQVLKYPLHVAEKDYLLTLVIQLIAQSQLGQTLIFKGGTALHHCYLQQHRFSEDLDFSSNTIHITVDQMKAIFTPVEYLTIKKEYLSAATLKIEKLQYVGPLVQPNSLKVEVDFLQNVVLPAQVRTYQNAWGINFTVRVMDIKEICAEKIRAMSGRARYRDFYDMAMLLAKYLLDLDEVVNLVRQKEVRQPITKTAILANWQLVLTQKEKDMRQIYFTTPIEDDAITAMIARLPVVRIP